MGTPIGVEIANDVAYYVQKTPRR